MDQAHVLEQGRTTWPTAAREATADTPAAAKARRADIQGLRAAAVLLVVAYHAGAPVPGGFMGVDIFFAISGYVITSMIVAELTASGRLDLGRFYLRRAKRLLPGLALMLTVVLLLSGLVGTAASQRMTAVTGATASLFSANLYLTTLGSGYFDVASSLNPFLHTWTLAVEEQFYLVFPVLLFLAWRVTRTGTGRRVGAAAAVAFVTIASFLLCYSLSRDPVTTGDGAARFVFYGAPARAWEFGAGALVALATPLAARLSPFGAWTLGGAGAVVIGVAVFSVHDAASRPGATGLVLPVAGACGLLAAGVRGTRGISRLLSVRPATWIGDLSYSWYLWHWPAIVLASGLWAAGAAAPTAALLSLVPAWLSYRFVENPIRTRAGMAPRAVAALAVACVVVPVAASGGLLGLRDALSGTAGMRAWVASQTLHADVRRHCEDPRPLGTPGRADCTWAAPAARGTIVLVGDSNAGQFAEPVVKAAARAHFDVTVATFSSCPFVDAHVDWRMEEPTCRRFYTGTMSALLRMKPGLVIIAARTDTYVEDPLVGLRDASGRLTHDPARKERLWRQGIRSTLVKLNGAGIRVVLVHPIPPFSHAPQECTALRILASGCSATVSRRAVDHRLLRARRAEAGALAATSTSWALDFEDDLCSVRMCSTSRHGTIMYRDGEHLSIVGALTLTRRFYSAIRAHAAASASGPSDQLVSSTS